MRRAIHRTGSRSRSTGPEHSTAKVPRRRPTPALSSGTPAASAAGVRRRRCRRWRPTRPVPNPTGRLPRGQAPLRTKPREYGRHAARTPRRPPAPSVPSSGAATARRCPRVRSDTRSGDTPPSVPPPPPSAPGRASLPKKLFSQSLSFRIWACREPGAAVLRPGPSGLHEHYRNVTGSPCCSMTIPARVASRTGSPLKRRFSTTIPRTRCSASSPFTSDFGAGPVTEILR